MQENKGLFIDTHTYKDIKPYVHEHDGYRHILVLHSYSVLSTRFFDCETRLTEQMDAFILEMQKNGYELHDIKISPLNNPNILGAVAGYSIMIIYS